MANKLIMLVINIKMQIKCPRANIILSGKRLYALSIILGRRQGCLLTQVPFSIVWEVPASATKQGEKRNTRHTDRKGRSKTIFRQTT